MESEPSPLVLHLSDRVGLLTSENASMKKRLVREEERRKELVMQLEHSVKQCSSLRDQVVKEKALNSKLLVGFRSLLAKVKERQRRLKLAEQEFRGSRFQHGWRAEDLEDCRRMTDNLKVVEERLLALEVEEDIQVKRRLEGFTPYGSSIMDASF